MSANEETLDVHERQALALERIADALESISDVASDFSSSCLHVNKYGTQYLEVVISGTLNTYEQN
jgi:hypothetical protein